MIATSIDDDITNRHPADILPQSNNKLYTKIISQSNDIQGIDNFPMGCSFSPDGTCILTATSSDGKFRLYDTPFQHLMNSTKSSIDTTTKPTDNVISCKDENESGIASKAVSSTRPQHETIQITDSTTYSHNQNNQPPTTWQKPNNDKEQQQYHSWSASLTSHQGGPPPSSSFASYCWYPLMTSSSPLTSLYATCRGHSMPIHLIDAYTSQLRASYCPYNAVDEMEGPTVVEFSPDGRRIYATGFKSDRTIAIFDTSIPGRDGMIARLGKTRRSSDGQKGIPSSIAFPKCSVGGPSNVFALGTYSPASIYIYDDRMSSQFQPVGTIVLHGGLTVVGHGRSFLKKKRRFNQVNNSNQVGGIQDTSDDNLFSSARVNWFQSRARGGITQLMWSPPTSNNPYLLFSASRRSNTVLSWDVRCLSGRDDFNGNQPVCGVQSYARDGDTNQRLEFDIDDTGKRIYVGSGDGVVKIYDITSGVLDDTLDVTSADDTRNNGVEKCTNAVNGVSFHHCNTGESGKYNVTLLSLAVGSRQYNELDSDEDNEVGCGEKQRCPGFLQLQSLME